MIRRIVPVIAMAALLGACSHNASSTTDMGSPRPSRANEDRGAGDGRGGRGGNGGQREEMALRGITLTGDQHQRIDAIRASYRTQMEQARQQSGSDRASMRQAMQPLMEKQQADVRSVLNPDQQAQYDRNIADMRARMQQGGGRQPNG